MEGWLGISSYSIWVGWTIKKLLQCLATEGTDKLEECHHEMDANQKKQSSRMKVRIRRGDTMIQIQIKTMDQENRHG